MYTSSQIRELLATITDDESLATADERVDIGHAVQRLPTPQDRLVVFALVQGYNDIQASAMLQLSTTATRKAIRNVLRQLREAMNEPESLEEKGRE